MSWSAVCLRAPGVKLEKFVSWRAKQSQCDESLHSVLKPYFQNTNAQVDELTKTLSYVSDQPDLAAKTLREFFDLKRKAVWSLNDAELVEEILTKWIELEKTPHEKSRLQSLLRSFHEVPLTGPPPDLEDAWKDMLLLRNGRPAPLRALNDKRPAHWAGISSVYQPVVHSGDASHFLVRLKQEKTPWSDREGKLIAGDKSDPGLNYLVLVPSGDSSIRPALINTQDGRPHLAQSAQTPKPFYQKKEFWLLTTVVAIAVGVYASSDQDTM